MWGAADIVNARVRCSSEVSAALTLAANLVSATIFAWIALVQELRESVVTGAVQQPLPFGWQHLLFLLANVSS